MQRLKTTICTVIFCLILSTPLYAQYVGIPSAQFNYFSASQQMPQWCWAASIQMVLNYYGVSITQPQIVARTYGVDPFGNLPNWSGNFQAITANLNNWNFDNMGSQYSVSSSVYPGAPRPDVLVNELSNGHPIMIGYKSGPNSGHAVVITAVDFTPTPQGIRINSIVVRDPWPSPQNTASLGRVEYPGAILANKIQAHWYIRVAH